VGTSKWIIDRIHKAGKVSVSLVGNVRHARRVAKLGTDIVVAQGTEAGGHTGEIGTLALVPQVVDAVAPIPVLAAGGLGDARGVAAAFTLGAKGVWIGTAFLASRESNITEECRQKIIESDESGTAVTRFFTGKTARLLRHPIAEKWQEAGFKSLGMPFQLFSVADLLNSLEQTGDKEMFVLPAGQVSGLIKESRPAKDVFDDLVSGAVRILSGCRLDGVTVGHT
jgi:NAD(P)H-dependent flavin oxidoreductase YrpB (nitropropane dioxygenase family)